jgi:hypothetical protein
VAAVSPDNELLVAEFDHEYEYGWYPLDTVTEAAPLFPLIQLVFVTLIVEDNCGSVISTLVPIQQSLPSWTITV